MNFINKKYSVELQKNISVEDQEILLNLYQPLIGASSISLYNTLVFENKWTQKMKSAIFTVERLMDLNNISQTRLKNNLGKLTKMKLLKIFKEKGTDNIVFVINKPLPAKTFLNNSQLKKMLCETLKVENFESVLFYFKEKNNIQNSREYINIEDEFADCTDPLFSKLNLSEISNLEEQNLPIYNSTNPPTFDKDDLANVKHMCGLEWVEYFQNCLGTEPNEITINSINKLKRDYNFTDGVINCLISYSYQKNNNSFVFNYISKIAETLKQKRITLPTNVYEFLKQLSVSKSGGGVQQNNLNFNKKVISDQNTVVLNDNVDIEW